MTLQEIISTGANWKDRITLIQEGYNDVSANVTEYRGGRELRETQVGKRSDKVKKSGEAVPVNKIPIPFNKHIVRTAASFMFGQPVSITSSSDVDLQPLYDTWSDLRMDPKLLQLCEKAKAFQMAALLFRIEENEKKERYMTTTILSPEHGKIVPIWAEFGKLDAIMYETEVKEGGESVVYYYLYGHLNVLILRQSGDTIAEVNGPSGQPHGFDRIPVVLIEEEQVEWEDVKPLIDRFENRFSRFADTNDYFSSPFFKAKGRMGEAMPEKDDTGTVYELDIYETDSGKLIESDLDVVSWDAAPEATRMELELSRGMIFDLSFTPDLSFNNVKGVGSVTGIAMKLMFMSSIMKRDFSKVIYEVAVKRCVNLTVAGMVALAKEGSAALVDVPIDLEFGNPLPDNLSEIIETLSTATMNQPIMSQQTALEHNPLVADPDRELEQIRKEGLEAIGGTEQLPA